ncbi:hypothetical protein R1sor_006394 [Riccia sorocarpa]|uniref:Uncharacterized protein n=1 Tax=Riccia sorocarpa TaxID=122646 RepID=A0ABD3HMX3_9MARC
MGTPAAERTTRTRSVRHFFEDVLWQMTMQGQSTVGFCCCLAIRYRRLALLREMAPALRGRLVKFWERNVGWCPSVYRVAMRLGTTGWSSAS